LDREGLRVSRRAAPGKIGLRAGSVLMALALAGCATGPRHEAKPAPGADKAPPDAALQPNSAPLMPPPPRQTGQTNTFNVTVNDMPVADVLFVLARDAKLSLDISPKVVGRVTLIAVDQTLPRHQFRALVLHEELIGVG
jgi:hypothetical protein